MKKIIVLMLGVFLLSFSLTACSDQEKDDKNTLDKVEDSQPENTAKVTTLNGKALTKIGFAAPAMDNEFMTNLKRSLEEAAAEHGIEVVTSVAEQSTAKQVEQIENMVTMGCEAICVSPVDLDAILDSLKDAKDKGVVISLCGVVPEDKAYYDVVANVEQYDLGNMAAKAAADWIDKTFPDAEDGSIEVAILALNNSTEAIKRADGLKSIEELTSKAKIVVEYDATGSASIPTKAQEYAEMMLISYPDVKCVLGYSDFMGLPADEVIMRTPGVDKETFGIFACDYSYAGCEAIEKSITNESTYRGSGAFGVEFGRVMFDTCVGNVEFDDLGVYYEPAFVINKDNVNDYLN